MSAAEKRKEAAQIRKQLDGGKIKGKERIFKARKRMAMLKYLANKESGKKSVKKTTKAKATAFNPAQGILPNFLEQLQPRVEEMAAQLVFEALKKSLETSMPGVEVTRKLKAV